MAVKSLFVAGYSAFDLGIFGEQDKKLKVIRKTIDETLEAYLDNGLEWLIFGGNLGFEYWFLQEAKKYQRDYTLKIATIFPFENHGENWNESNQLKLQEFRQVDFVKYSFKSYENPSQFRVYDQFLMDNTDAALFLYDEENETKLKYLYDMMKEAPDYSLDVIDFERLQNIAENINDEEENYDDEDDI